MKIRTFFLKAMLLLSAAAAQPAMAQHYYVKKKSERQADAGKVPEAPAAPSAAKPACNQKERQAIDRLEQALKAMNAQPPTPADKALARQMQDILNDPAETPKILALFAKCRYGETY